MRDIDIRGALRRELTVEHAAELDDTLILDELGLCQGVSRVDMAVINGSIIGYEIKSPKDTLTRLPTQQEVYSKTLDRVILVAGEDHLTHLWDMIPEWWGVQVPYVENDEVVFRVERDAGNNPGVDPYSLAQLLWRDEAVEELTKLGLERGIKSKPRAVVWERLAGSVSLEQLSEIVRTRLKARSNWRSD